MNKTYLIAGGFSVASLAIGAAGGYLVAKKRFDEQLDLGIAIEVDKAKKHYSLLLMQKDKPDLADIPVHEDPVVEEEEPADPTVVANGQAALVNYQGYADKPKLETIVPSNIFTPDKSQPNGPPRDPETGKFLPKNGAHPESPKGPYVIDELTFLQNEPENDQDSVLYYVHDETCVLTSDLSDVVPDDRIGEEFLSEMLEMEEPRVIYVRHDGLGIDYQITLTEDRLTDALGLGESEADVQDYDDEDEEEEHDDLQRTI